MPTDRVQARTGPRNTAFSGLIPKWVSITTSAPDPQEVLSASRQSHLRPCCPGASAGKLAGRNFSRATAPGRVIGIRCLFFTYRLLGGELLKQLLSTLLAPHQATKLVRVSG